MTFSSLGIRIKNYILSHTLAAVLIIVLLIVVYFSLGRLQVPMRNIYEDISFSIAPSGEKAFAYGEAHFNAKDPAEYDIDRASRFFQAAVRLDPTLPYVHHEIARIYFLHGDFGNAMQQIDIQIQQEGDRTANSYYIRGLIEGYMGAYADSANDYEHFLKSDPYNWAALNDYSWVLLKGGRIQDAFFATSKGLERFPANPWLLNSNAIALYEMGYIKDAKTQAAQALKGSENVTVADWLHAYPGNDPKIAQAGVEAFKKATAANMHSIISSSSTHALQ
jgi:tetratricopeptide (TPR) repeat protein